MKIDAITYSVKPPFSGSTYARLSTSDLGLTYQLTMYRSTSRVHMALPELQHMMTEYRNIPRSRLKTSTKVLSAAQVEQFLQSCKTITIFAIPDYTTGFDGTDFTLTFECGSNSVTYHWWADLPRQWRGLNIVVEQMTHWLVMAKWRDVD